MQHLTGLTDALRPRVCQGCAWWQTPVRAREVDRPRWIEEFEERYGSWGKLYLDGERHVGSLQYGPAQAFPRGASMPAGPPSDDAVLVTCSYLSDPVEPVGAAEPVPRLPRRVEGSRRARRRGVRLRVRPA